MTTKPVPGPSSTEHDPNAPNAWAIPPKRAEKDRRCRDVLHLTNGGWGFECQGSEDHEGVHFYDDTVDVRLFEITWEYAPAEDNTMTEKAGSTTSEGG